jgi:hypothetical protein
MRKTRRKENKTILTFKIFATSYTQRNGKNTARIR